MKFWYNEVDLSWLLQSRLFVIALEFMIFVLCIFTHDFYHDYLLFYFYFVSGAQYQWTVIIATLVGLRSSRPSRRVSPLLSLYFTLTYHFTLNSLLSVVLFLCYVLQSNKCKKIKVFWSSYSSSMIPSKRSKYCVFNSRWNFLTVSGRNSQEVPDQKSGNSWPLTSSSSSSSCQSHHAPPPQNTPPSPLVICREIRSRYKIPHKFTHSMRYETVSSDAPHAHRTLFSSGRKPHLLISTLTPLVTFE